MTSFSNEVFNKSGVRVDANSKQGTGYVNQLGIPTSTLKGIVGQATPIPSNAEINKYIVSGSKHFGSMLIGETTSPVGTQPTVPPTQATVPPTQATVPPTQATVPPTQATVPPTQATVPPTQATVPPTAPPLSSKQDIAIRKILADNGLSKVRVDSWNDPVLKGRAYYPKSGWFNVAVDFVATVDANGNYTITGVSWIVSFSDIP